MRPVSPESEGGTEEERIVPGTEYWDTSYPDHIQRYRFALEFVPPGALVLDAGCGVGYGAAEIAAHRGAKVVAVDISEEAIRLARMHFDRPDITWCRDDCQSLERTAALGPFDVIINFENIEHLEQPDRFVARAAALLRPDGVLLTSTPNRHLINQIRGVAPDARSANPYHPSEMDEREFRSLLSRYFEHVEVRYQSPVGAGRRRLRLRSIAAALHLLPAFRAVKRLLSPTRSAEASRGSSMPDWIIEGTDRGTAWTLLAVCRGPRAVSTPSA